jgi:hypothetical protein
VGDEDNIKMDVGEVGCEGCQMWLVFGSYHKPQEIYRRNVSRIHARNNLL